MRHFYAIIINSKANHIVYIVFPVETNSSIQIIQDHQLILNSTIYNTKNGSWFMPCNLKDFFLAYPM